MTITERLSAAFADRYAIERELGQGGMATVYLAADLKHDRRVAIKVLKPELAAVLGAERFVQEIKTTAALQHPHILPLYDSGQADGFLFYVMPFIDGETLRARLDRETQLGVDEAVKLASAVADALDYAHRHGVIHRDIKPENILLHDGRPVVADFGIALALSAAAGGRMTETGMSLGTPHYMSPEQATADKDITARSDIYSLASVLYEMLAGQPPHLGGSAQQIIMKIIAERVPPVTDLRRSVPPHVAAALAQALEKLPADRFATARAFADALANHSYTHAGGGATATATRARRRVPAGAGIVGLVAISAAATGWMGGAWSRRTAPPLPIRFATTLGSPGRDAAHLAISPDGRRIAQAVSDSIGGRRLMVRDLTSNTVTALAGTDGAREPEFSSDGQWIAFVQNSALLKVPAAGGPATVLLDSVRVLGGGIAWSSTGDIVFSRRDAGLWLLPAAGGPLVQLTSLDTARKEFAHWSPQFLPGERAVIFTNYATPVAQARIEAYHLGSRRSTVLATGAVFGRHAPSGHLLYARDAAVFAAPFDAARLAIRGPAVPVQDDVAWRATDGIAGYAIAPNGTFAYLRQSEWSSDRTLVWRDRRGNDTPVLADAGPYWEPRLSPDGRWIALTVTRPKSDVWLYDVARRVLTQLTRAPAYAFNAVWLPDSRRLAYSYEDRVYELHLTTIDGSAPDRVVVSSPFDKYATSASPDGRTLLISETVAGERLAMAWVDGDSARRPMADTRLEQRAAVYSPDGRWIAYSEHSAASADVYLSRVGGGGGRRLVSAAGGTEPRWTRGGREIVYLSGTAMMSVPVNPGTGAVGTPVPLFRVTDLDRDPAGRTHSYDVTPDGSRFLVLKRVDRPAALPLVVVLNWAPGSGSR